MRKAKVTNGWLDDIRDLKLSYRKTYWMLRQYLKECEKYNKNEDGVVAEVGDIPVIKDAIADVNFAIQWLHTGKRPGNKRGIERRAAYQREKLMDPIRMQAFVQKHTAGSPANLSEWQRFQIEAALSLLSDRERECYVMAHGECISHEEIAAMLNISVGSVSQYVSRAQKKISKEVQDSLFFSK